MHNNATSGPAGYRAELLESINLLADAASELHEPLRPLVQRQIQRAAPHGRAAMVLAFAVPGVDSEGARMRRIYLAAALEMLFIAHRIHTLLLAPEAEEMDKSIMGSTILTGDLCYSRAAAMAVQTDSTEVVRIFSDALKRVSEGNLRSLFSPAADPFDETESLFASAIHAGQALAGVEILSEESRGQLARQLAAVYAHPDIAELSPILADPRLQAEERLRIQSFFAAN